MALLDHAESLLGPLSPAAQKLIRAYLNRPSGAGWDRIKTIMVAPSVRFGTLWQAVIDIDPTFPRVEPAEGWDARFPDAVTLARAIRAATSVTY